MAEKLDSDTRVAKLRSLNLSTKYAALLAQHALEAAADAEIAEAEAAQEAERERIRELATAIEEEWKPVPTAANNLVVFCYGNRPTKFEEVKLDDGRLHVPVLPNLSVGFLRAELAPTLKETSGGDWSRGTVRSSVFILEALGPESARRVLRDIKSEAAGLIACVYRAYARSLIPAERSVAEVAHSRLEQFGYSHPTERVQIDAVADRIWAMVVADAPAAAPEVDHETEQRHMTGVQLTTQFQKWSERAEREAAKVAAGDAP